MKNSKISILIILCCLLIAFTGGFFLGRNANHTPIQVDKVLPDSNVPETTLPTQTVKININTASVEQLQTLPGIGPVLAQRIYDYRTEHGAFKSVAGLMEVEGIGQKTLDAILDYITVGG